MLSVTSQKYILFNIQVNLTKGNKFQNKVYNLSHTPASHVHSTIIAIYKTTRKARIVKIKFYNIINTRKKSKPYQLFIRIS